jgi:hypothetical protein
MSNEIVKGAIRAWFATTSREKASARIRSVLKDYIELAGKVDEESGARAVRVPRMMGVDEDMRDWSFYMILEHDVIVNRIVTTTIESLARGEKPVIPGVRDPKADVMPSAGAGREQVDAFRESVDAHLRVVSGLDRMRGTMTKKHPVFGELDSHRWHCMFGFHLVIHYKQAASVVRSLLEG